MPERLRKPHVPDPGDEALVEQRLPEQTRLIGRTEARDEVGDIGLVRQKVRPERSQRPVVEREHGAVPLCGLPLPAPQHEPREAAPHGVARLEPPPTTHSQMAAENQAALEAQEEVLADRFDALEHASVEDARDTGGLPARVRALGFDPISHE